jgi:ferritin-like metal-binding protein YciE
MNKIQNLRDLLVYELQDLYSAENQLVKALPKVADACQDPKLKQAFTQHLEQTKNQVTRLEQCFEALGEKHGNEVCNAMQGLIKECDKVLQDKGKFGPAVFDAAVISACQRVEHYEMAGYGSARAFCEELGEDQCLRLLQQTFDEEVAADRKLSELAVDEINRKASQQQATAM